MEYLLTIKTSSLDDLKEIILLIKSFYGFKSDVQTETKAIVDITPEGSIIEKPAEATMDLSNLRDIAFCEECGEPFRPKSSASKYCNDKCAAKGYNKNKRKELTGIDLKLYDLKQRYPQSVNRPNHQREL